MSSTALVPKSKKVTKVKESEVVEDTLQPKDLTELKAETDAMLDEIDRVLDQDSIQRARDTLEALSDVKPYTLADAMREGSMFTDQAIGAWTTPVGETCALSAAMLAIRARGLA